MALTRRTTLLAGAALGGAALLAGCADHARPAAEAPEQSAAAERLRARAARDSTALLARYDATLAAHPALGTPLRPLRAEVARHAEAFASDRPSAGASASASTSASAPPAGAARGAGAPRVPADERGARTALADAERTLADARTAALVSAPPELARLLASVAAAGAAHAYLLTETG
ncbi:MULTISPECIES: hypothetical protein [unclassified Streptomyces]|uniref:hypothetical protein n=1 Tax=unclassified Streptomyces TaxID=2593676 RepID=UPI000C27EE6C|nr:hypothetical protein [Streptomyces sp. CB02959]PJN42738.1 hypothetical protein CG747_00200 [Streptomyces sp. CB02959]